MYLELLTDHHTSIYALLKQLSGFSSASMLTANAEEASRAISRLAGLLTVHLAAEDKFLYPSLARSEDEHIRALRLEKALLDAELEMAKLRQQLKTQEEESEVGKLVLRLSSTHPTVRMLAVSASVEWIRSPVLQNAVDDMLRRFPPDRDMMLLIPNLARDRELHLRFATVIAGRAGMLDESAALLFLQWTGSLRERGPLLAKFLAHPSHAVLTGTLQRWPAKHPVPDDLSLLRLLRIDDEEILLPLLRLLRGASVPVWARPRLKNLADAHPSPGVRVWARSIVGSADLV